MFKLIVVLCLIADPSSCLPPTEVVPAAGEISGLGGCLKGGAIYAATAEGLPQKREDYFAKISCQQQSPSEFQSWLEQSKTIAKAKPSGGMDAARHLSD